MRDIIRGLCFAHRVSAEDPVEAIYRAIADYSLLDIEVIRSRIRVEKLPEHSVYRIIDEETLSRMYVTVYEESPLVRGLPLASESTRIMVRIRNIGASVPPSYIVTFYPETYEEGEIFKAWKLACQYKEPLHKLARRLNENNIQARVIKYGDRNAILIMTKYGNYVLIPRESEPLIRKINNVWQRRTATSTKIMASTI